MLNRNLVVLASTLMLLGNSSLVLAQCGSDLSLVSGKSITPGYAINLNTSNGLTNWLSNDGSELIMQYPGGQGQYGFVFVTDGPSIPPGNRPGRDVSAYQTLQLVMKGDPGSVVNVGIKDSSQPDDGSETTVAITVAASYQTYSIPLSNFVGANLKSIYVMVEWVFLGSQPQTLDVKSVAYSCAPPVTPMVLPHFVFGGGWSSALYFSNTGGTPTSFQVNSAGDNGSPLVVPSVGAASTTVNLAPRASTVIQIPNTGSLTDGYVSVALPIGVVGYEVLDETVQGMPNQEAVVPLSPASTTTSTLIWDETSFEDSVSIVNPSNATANVSVNVYDPSGNTLATSSIVLGAGNKMQTFLENLSGLAAVAGGLGSVDFVANTGNVAVVVLRSDGTAFTSIPTNNR